MKTIKFLSVAVMALAISVSSCAKDGEDGSDGAPGAQGIQGETGPAGPAGEDGQDGQDGTDGQDGNANVQTYVFDVSDRFGASIPVTVPALTQDVLDNDLVLGYLTKTETHVPLPHPVYAVSLGDNYTVAVELERRKYWMFFYEVGTENLKNITAGKLNNLKIVIIESSNTTTGKSGKKSILSELKANGVDINNYYSVMDYYGVAY